MGILSKVIGETPSPMCDYFPKGSSVKSTVVQTLGAKSIAKKKKKQQNPRTKKKKTLSNLATESNRGRETHSKIEIEVKSRNKTKQNKTNSLNGASVMQSIKNMT